MTVSPFMRAVPGQSLTDKPGNAAWEHPPQFTDAKKALDYIFQQLMMKKNLMQFYAVMEHKDANLEGIARTIVFTGFHSGKWTPTLGMIIMPAIVIMLAGIARKVGIKAKLRMPRKDIAKDMMVKQRLAEKIAEKMKFSPTQTPPGQVGDDIMGSQDQTQPQGNGLMSPPGAQ